MPALRAGNAADAEAAMLPVRSTQLSPGEVQRRVIRAPGLTALFLIGDDERSRAWLRQRQAALRELQAVGLVVNVESMAALTALRRLAPGLTLSPASGDDWPSAWACATTRCSSRPPASSSRCAMAQPHAVEVLLRPAVELHTVAVCTGAAILCLVAPWSPRAEPAARPGLGAGLPDLRRDSPARCLGDPALSPQHPPPAALRDDQPRRAGESATAVRRPGLSLGAAAHAPADADLPAGVPPLCRADGDLPGRPAAGGAA